MLYILNLCALAVQKTPVQLATEALFGECEEESWSLEMERRTSDQKNTLIPVTGVLSTTANLNVGSVDTGTGCAVREEQTHDFDPNQDSVVTHNNQQ